MADQIHSPFLSLPAELKLMIFEFLWMPADQSIDLPTNLIHQSSQPSSSDLNLLLTCRQIHAEAQKIAFRNHVFTISRVISKEYMRQLSIHAPYNLITSILIASYGRTSPRSVDLPHNHPSRLHPTKLFTHIRRFISSLPALQNIYCGTTTAPARLGLWWRSMMAQTRYRWKVRKASGQDVGSWVGWDLTREDEGETEGDAGRWKLKVWMPEEGNGEQGEWKVVNLVVYSFSEEPPSSEVECMPQPPVAPGRWIAARNI